MDASSLPPSELDEFFDAVETQPNHPFSLFNSPTAIRTRRIPFSSPLPSQNEDEYSPFREPTISRSPSRSPTPSTPPPMTLAPPSTRKEYATAEGLLENINKEAGLQGYELARRGYKKDKRGELRKIWLGCDRGKSYKPTVNEDDRKRQQTSRACECPWKGYALCTGGIGGSWSLVLIDHTHNHKPTRAEAYLLLRKLDAEDRAFIANETHQRIGPYLTTSKLRARQPDRPLKRKDVYNARAKVRAEDARQYTRIQGLLDQLSKDEWVFEWDVDDWDQLTALMFFHVRSIELLRKFNCIYFMDCTYKTNRYNMPLLIIISMTSCKKTFYVGFAFMKHETFEYYEWCMKVFDKLLTQYGL